MTNYINRGTRYNIKPEIVYLSITLGLLYTTILSGKLNLIKNISLSQLFMLTFLIETYGIQNLGMICMTLAGIMAIFMGLKF